MLAHTPRDDYVLLAMRSLLIQLLYDLLRFHRLPFFGFHIRERVILLSLFDQDSLGVDMIKYTKAARFETAVHMIGICASTTLFAFLGRISKWMIPPRPCAAATLRGRGELVHFSCRTIVKTSPKRGDNVGQVRAPMHAKHVQTFFFRLVKRSQEGRRKRNSSEARLPPYHCATL